MLWAVERIMDDPSIPNKTVQNLVGHLPPELLTDLLRVRLLLRDLEAELASGTIGQELRLALEPLEALLPKAIENGKALAPPHHLIQDVRLGGTTKALRGVRGVLLCLIIRNREGQA